MAILVRLLLLIACCVSAILGNEKSHCWTRTSEPKGYRQFLGSTANFNEERCRLTIRYAKKNGVKLTLVNVRQYDESCPENYVRITSNNLNEPTRKYCIGGRENEEILWFKSNVVTVTYKISFANGLDDTTINSAGFHYEIVKPKLCRHILNGLTGQRRTVQSPGFPGYVKDSECEWTIITQRRQTILLSFNFNYRQWPIHGQNCDTSFVEVRDGSDQNAPLLRTFCNSNENHAVDVGTIVSTGPKMWIRMKSTDTLLRFNATYTIKPICQQVTSQKPVELKAPRDYACKTWELTAPPGQIAALSFSMLNLRSTSLDGTSCSGNVVKVWDGEKTTTYCNTNHPPSIITPAKGRTLVVKYMRILHWPDQLFYASFTTVAPSNYKSSCFVYRMKLKFQCGDKRMIPCDRQCDGATQCPDGSDEDSCTEMQAGWHKLQVFVIVMGSICASTVIFCLGVVCFRRLIIQAEHISDSYGRRWSTSDQSPLTPNADLPSPPPGYFNDSDSVPPNSIVRGTYFFGDQFSQSGIHSASLFGIPPPRYRSMDSLNQCNVENSEGSGQFGSARLNFPLVETNFVGGDLQNRADQTYLSSLERPPECSGLEEKDKSYPKLTNQLAENGDLSQQTGGNTEQETANSSQTLANCITDTNLENVDASCQATDTTGTMNV